jgi:hypothetical protein
MMAMVLHVVADDDAVKNVQSGGEQGGSAVAFLVVRHGAEAALLQRQVRLGAVDGLDLGLLVDRQARWHARRRIDMEPDYVAQFGGVLELAIAVRRLQPVRLPNPSHGAGADAARLRHQVGGRHDSLGHLLAARRKARGVALVAQKAVDALLHEPLPPAPETVLDLPVCRMIALVPTPSALSSTIAARQTCFCGALRSLVMASSRARSERVTEMEIPVRMRQARTPTAPRESEPGLLCQPETLA